MARPRKPTNILSLSGAFKKNPQRAKERANEPEPTGKIGAVPKHLTDDERRAWRDLVATAPEGVLCKFDRLALEAAAKCLAEMRAGSFDHLKEWRQWCSRFGMTPADRSRVQAPKAPKAKSPYERPDAS